MAERIALIPGTFDPVTAGHLALIETASALFDRVVVCILINPDKRCMFDEETRRNALLAAVKELSGVHVDICHGMTADYAEKIGACAIVRGVRNAEDTAYELEMADFNRKRSDIPTCLIPAAPGTEEISSTRLRDMLRQNAHPDSLLPEGVYRILKKSILDKNNQNKY